MNKLILKNCIGGFTLIELLLSVSIIAIVSFFGVPVYQSFQTRNDLSIAASTVIQESRRAQVLSKASLGDSAWGLKVESGSIVLFKGSSYLLRDNTYDEIFDLGANITPSGLSEVVYAKFTGTPSTTGDIVLTSNINETRTITINSKGTIIF